MAAEKALKHKLVYVDGLTGSGKSTAAQYLDIQYRLNGRESRWYHEEENGHPLFYGNADIEVIHTAREARTYMADFLILLEQFAQSVRDSEQVHILESFYLQDSVRIPFQNNVPEEKILTFFREMNRISAPLEPFVIYYRHDDPVGSIRKIWAERGEEWKKWFIDADSKTSYVLSRDLTGEEGPLTLWSDFQDLTDRLTDDSPFPQLTLNRSETRETSNRRMTDALGLDNRPLSPLPADDTPIGSYAWEDGDESHQCRLYLKEGTLHTDLLEEWWGEKPILYDGSRLMLDALPCVLSFAGGTGHSEFTVTGGRIDPFTGRTYRRR